MLRTRHLASAIAATLLFSSVAVATDFSQVVVFGDSLSDDGNISLATNPSVQPPLRFTTNPGLVAIEDVANGLGVGSTLSPSLLGGSDYAWGGAGVNTNSPGTPAAVPTITSQVGAYLAGNPISPPGFQRCGPRLAHRPSAAPFFSAGRSSKRRREVFPPPLPDERRSPCGQHRPWSQRHGYRDG
jgi:hypothetical protein